MDKEGDSYRKAKSIEDFKKLIAKNKETYRREIVFKDKITEDKKNSSHLNIKSSFKSNKEKSFSKENQFEIKKNKKNSMSLGRFFSEFDIDKGLVKSLKLMEFERTTEVQEKTLPFSLNRKNIICASETGSGKTLAFLIPMIEGLIKKTINQALILSPTREIAIQTDKVLNDLLTPLNIKSGLVIGGTDVLKQKHILREYPSVLVATPGRLLDMISSGLVWLNYTEFVVLDEADRMLDMGFEEELMSIHKELPGHQQTLLFTATLLPIVEKVVTNYAQNFKKILIGKPVATNKSITHFIVKVDQRNRLSKLIEMIKKSNGKVIIFFNTIRETTNIYQELQKKRIRGISIINSSKSQEERERTIAQLKSGEKRVLLATDVAARGIDIPYVNLVINYHLPFNPEDYIHRIGRTGRAGNRGVAKSLYTSKDKRLLTGIESVLKQKLKFESQ